MKAKIEADACTGCELCVDTCPEVFEMDGDVAVVKGDVVAADVADSCRESSDACPAECIEIEE